MDTAAKGWQLVDKEIRAIMLPPPYLTRPTVLNENGRG
jgi:hypothetical protein